MKKNDLEHGDSREILRPEQRRLDWKVARQLVENPTLSNKDIGEILGRHENVIQRRRASMIKREILRKGFVVSDWEKVGLPLRFRIDIRINQEALLDPNLSAVPADYKGSFRPKTQEQVAHFIEAELVDYLSSVLKSEPRLQNISDQLFIEDVTIILGNPTADISAFVRGQSHAAILKFVTRGLRMMRVVSATATYQEAWSCKEGHSSF